MSGHRGRTWTGTWTLATVVASSLAAAPTAATVRHTGTVDGPGDERATVPVVEWMRPVSGASPLPDDCGYAEGAAAVHAEVEPHLAVDPSDPDHLLAAWQQDRYTASGGARSNVTAVSFDGGATWTPPSALPGTTACTQPASRYLAATDPWGTIGADGTAYVASLAFEPTASSDADDAELVSVSPDGGRSWRAPVELEAGEEYLEKIHVAADPAHRGRIYAVWAREELETPLDERIDSEVRFALSRDHGRTWSDPVTVPPNAPADWEWPVDLLAVPRDDGTTRLVVVQTRWRKTLREPPGTGVERLYVLSATVPADGRADGLQWSASLVSVHPKTIVRGDAETVTAVDAGTPRAAVSRGGTLYVVWPADTPVGIAPGGTDIRLARSDDGAGGWVTSTVVRHPGNAFLPSVAVAGDGTVGVSWYDDRADLPGDDGLTADVWFASSTDRGASWDATHLAGPFDLRQAPRNGNRWFLGDYVGLVGLPRGFAALVALADPATGDGPTDVHLARIGLRPAGPPHPFGLRRTWPDPRHPLHLHTGGDRAAGHGGGRP